MTVSPRVTHNLVTPQLAALQLSPACATFISIKHNTVFAFVYNPLMTHPTAHNPYSMFYYPLLRQALCMHSDWYQTTRSGILDIITNNVVTLL